MKEYIEREAALTCKQPLGAYGMDISSEDIKAIPAANVVEVRHGRWLSKEYMYGDAGLGDAWFDRPAEQSDYYANCSVCGKDAEYNAEGSLILSDYCPNCGAKMSGGVEEEE